jgi:hypothetical protein
MTADALQDALEQALHWMTIYGGAASDPTVTVNKDFGVSFMTPQEITALLSAVKDGVLSRETLVTELARRGVIRSDITPEEEFDRIDQDDAAGSGEEADALTGTMGGMPLTAGS